MKIEPHLTWGLVAIAFGWIVIALLVAGCGADVTDTTKPGAPTVSLFCEPGKACTILVHNADSISAWYDGVFTWSVDNEYRVRRYTVRDAAPEFSLEVEACNEYGCTTEVEFIDLLALGCDSNCGENDPICIPCDLGDYS